jgi:hypothetical protein
MPKTPIFPKKNRAACGRKGKEKKEKSKRVKE